MRRALLVTQFHPEDIGAAADRVRGLQQGLEAAGFVTARAILPVRKPLYARRYEPWWYLRPSRNWQAALITASKDADLVIASYLPVALAALPVLRQEKTPAPLIYDAHNDESHLAGQVYTHRHVKSINRMEDEVVAACDAIWIAGRDDRDTFNRRYSQAKVLNLPNGVEPMPDLSGVMALPRSAFTYGSWHYEPNRRGLLKLASAPTSTHGHMSVFGSLSSRLRAQVMQAAEVYQPGMRWTFRGFEPNFHAMAAAGGTGVIPVWHGAGTKLRAVQLAAMAVPACVTEEALSGLPGWFGQHVRIENEPDRLMEAALAAGNELLASARTLRELVRERMAWTRLVREAIDATVVDGAVV